MENTLYKNYKVSVDFTGSKKAEWGNNYNHHKITVKNTDTNKQATFDFWGSIAKPSIEGDKYSTLNAVYCWVSDALSAKDYDIDAFAKEFGYETPSQIIRTYKACEKSLSQVERVIDEDIYDFINELGENYA